MNKIIRKAIKAQYPQLPEDTVDALMLIFNKTGNPNTAAEMFLGVFEVPVIPDTPFTTSIGSMVVTSIKDIDFFDSTVYFLGHQRYSKSTWILKGTSLPDYTDTDLLPGYREDAIRKVGIAPDTFNKLYEQVTLYKTSDSISSGSCSFAVWLTGKD